MRKRILIENTTYLVEFYEDDKFILQEEKYEIIDSKAYKNGEFQGNVYNIDVFELEKHTDVIMNERLFYDGKNIKIGDIEYTTTLKHHIAVHSIFSLHNKETYNKELMINNEGFWISSPTGWELTKILLNF